jgi:hypothetical protein
LAASWSDCHILEKDKKEKRYYEIATIPKLLNREDKGLPNIVGVMENILEVPERAGRKYKDQLNKKFGDKVPAGVFAASGINAEKLIELYVDQFIELHTDWFDKM